MTRALPLVSVVGSGTLSHADYAAPLGARLAALGVHLVTGGGGGAMAEVARGFTEAPGRRGLSIGILPADAPDRPTPPTGYPNAWVEVPIRTHLADRGERGRSPGSRNHLVVLTGEVVVALPGAAGTRAEVELAVTYGKPVIAYGWDPEELAGLSTPVPLADSLEAVTSYVKRVLARGA